MINSLQLRLGNYLWNNCRSCETIVKVSSLNDHQIGCGIEGVKVSLCYELQDYKPIPLTRKMMLGISRAQSLEIEIESDSNGFFYPLANGHTVRLTYLHQLQNLYFTLTGQELPVTHEMVAAGTQDLAAAN